MDLLIFLFFGLPLIIIILIILSYMLINTWKYLLLDYKEKTLNFTPKFILVAIVASWVGYILGGISGH